jgi:hypothetical protein
MRGSLHKIEIEHARKDTIKYHKGKLNTQKSLSKGGQLYVFQGIHQISAKHHKKADEKLKKAKKVLQVVENKLKIAFEEKEKKGHRDEIT